MKKNNTKFINTIAIIMLLLSLLFFYKGYDKMVNYNNSEDFPTLNTNAYVGGDAYNYIINGNYSTGYFVLGVGFMLTSTVLFGTGFLIDALAKEQHTSESIIQPGQIIEGSSQHQVIQLAKYKELLDIGAITEEEYNKKKKEIIS